MSRVITDGNITNVLEVVCPLGHFDEDVSDDDSLAVPLKRPGLGVGLSLGFLGKFQQLMHRLRLLLLTKVYLAREVGRKRLNSSIPKQFPKRRPD